MKNFFAIAILTTVSLFVFSPLKADPLPSTSTAAVTLPTLPVPIKTLLDQQYPGWHFAPASKAVLAEFAHHQAKHPPYFLMADFDGDGQTDYAVQIIHGRLGQEEQNVIAYHVHDTLYEETVLESLGPNPSVYIGSAKHTLTNSTNENGLYIKDRIVIMGGDLGETSYEYDNGKFLEVNATDGTYE
jgi:hypothetical protein